IVYDLLARVPLLFERLKVLHQVAYGKIGRVALTVVAVFLTKLERLHVRGWYGLASVPQPLKRAMNKIFMFPRETAEKHSGMRALTLREEVLDRALEVLSGLEFQTQLAS